LAKKKAKKKSAKRKSTTQAKEKPSHSTGQTKTDNESPVVTPYPQAGQKVVEFENAIDAALAGGQGPESKRGRGRPRKEEVEAAQSQIDIKVVAQAIQIPFDLWSVSQGIDQLKISSDEAVLIAKPAKQLLDYYMPNVPEIAWAWIALSAASYSIVKSRLVIIAEIKKQSTSSSVKENSTGDMDRPDRRDHGRSRSDFPTVKEIAKPNPVT